MIAGRTFHGDYARSVVKKGLFLDPDGIKGWLGGGTWRREEIAKPNGFGAFNLPGQLPQKVIPVSGSLIVHDRFDLAHEMKVLSGILGDGLAHRMSVVDHDGTTFRDVGLAISPDIVEVDAITARFTMSVWAADPRAYGETNYIPAGGQAVHYGNVAAFPVLTVRATTTMAGYTILGPGGKQYVVTQTLPAGSTAQIDMRTGWMTRGGVQQLGAVARADTWSIPGGQPVTQTLVPASGTGVLTAEVIDTFI
ncbi:hypothetical protein [Microbacterium sp. MYb62]|uniref:hypothetical protein n=1 Tax=Microbacterium sp. MYb62 TaxID=1848690 RepID=UPI000CFAC6ED|nr:hypothetical protein [Microbacterium sp. MYb62]PRB14461.1 hypothetical protein CQ042_11110 [Microbacterium sp. MYb62]